MAYTLGTTYPTEFAGAHKTVTVLVDGGTQTGTVSFNTHLTTIKGAQATLAENASANAAVVIVQPSGTQVVCREFTGAGVLCTQTALDFYLTVIGEI